MEQSVASAGSRSHWAPFKSVKTGVSHPDSTHPASVACPVDGSDPSVGPRAAAKAVRYSSNPSTPSAVPLLPVGGNGG